jgi:sulfoxide reductase catalytic subunit YedY
MAVCFSLPFNLSGAANMSWIFRERLLFCRRRLTHCLLKEPDKISSSEITDPAVYFNRRTFLRAGILAASVVATGLAYRRLNHAGAGALQTARIEDLAAAPKIDASGFRATEPETSLQDVTHYNNFYEFSTDKEAVATAAANFETKGWQVSVEGLAA